MAKKGEGIFEPIGPPLFRARVFLGRARWFCCPMLSYSKAWPPAHVSPPSVWWSE
jgi:hypothetical protein